MAAAAEDLKAGNGDLPSLGDRSNRQPAKVLTLYRNGDNFFPGKKFTWNMHQIRTFDTLLEHFSSSLNLRGGAVRRLYTPEHGHRVKNLDILEEGKAYVAAPQERFKKIDYANIDQIRKRRNKRAQVSYDVPPVVHARHQVSGRIKRVNTMGKVIKCWANGEDVNEPHTVHIPPSLVNEQTWDRIFDLMTIAVRDLTGPPVKVYTRQGQEVVNPQDLDHMGYYIIAPKFNARFKDVEYKEVRRANFHTSPVPERRVLPPVRSKNNSKSNSLQSSPDHSWASHPGSENGYSQRHRRNLARQRQEEAQSQGFYAKPTAHKRSGEAKGKQVDLDQDKGGVFKAKNQNKATRGAQEVRETRDTRTEVPVDQRKAEVVSDEEADWQAKESARSAGPEEELKTNKKGKDDTPKPANGPRNARQSDAKTNKPQNDPPPAKAKTNSYRGPPPTNSQPPPNSQPAPASNGIKQNSPPATSTPKTDPKNKQPVKKAKSPSPPPPAKREMSEDEAATRIQAQFRGHQTRKEMDEKSQQPPAASSKQEDKRRSPSPRPNDDMSEEEAATKIQASFRGYQARREVEHAKASTATPQRDAHHQQQQQGPRSPSPAGRGDGKTEAEKEEEAATKIQAVYRGHATRRQLADEQQNPGGPPSSLTPVPGFVDDDDDAEDPGQRAREEAAATKIQATYRGHATRRELQSGKGQNY